jgi:hypothetical protein
MNNLVRCKACGYIMKANKVKDVCPACGLPGKVFEPYRNPLSEKRSRLLDLHLHPILVHFPQAFASIIPFLLVGALIVPGPFTGELFATAFVLVCLLPLTIIPTMLAGLIDAKTRFKSVTTPLIIKKIILGLSLFIFSIIGAVIVILNGINTGTSIWLFITSIACIVCEIALGKIGEGIMEAKLPG